MPLLAQTSTTSVRGTITDPSGALVPGAPISLTNTADNSVTNGTSDKSGLFAFPQLAPGTYLITVTAPGFAPSSKQAQLLVNQPATINFQLGVQSTQTVNVSAEAQTLNKTDASIGSALDNQVLQALPAEGRNVPDLLSLQPGVLYLGRGVNKDTDSRTGAVAGARSDQGNVTLDGLDDNDQTQGYAFTGVLRSTIDSTDEFRVATVNSDAQSRPLLRRTGLAGDKVRHQQLSRRCLSSTTGPALPSRTTGSTSKRSLPMACPTCPAS